jgi:hypothetical protein
MPCQRLHLRAGEVRVYVLPSRTSPTVGVTQRQISTDVRSNFSPVVAEVIDPTTGEVLAEPARVTGLDGKTYTRPAPVAPPPSCQREGA